MKKKSWRFIALLLLSVITTGCGFHLRGFINMPRWISPIAVIVEHANRDLGPYLAEYLHAYDLTVVPTPNLAKYWLIIASDNLQHHIASVSSSTTPRQYDLIYSVEFKLVASSGLEILPSSTVSIMRQATINSNRILGSNQEEAILVNEMRREAALQIMNRISIELSKGHTPPAF
jgi:LPS-assembly lipoprotein